MTRKWIFLAATAALLTIGGTALGGNALADEAGTVLFATGTVTAEREPPVPLAKGDAVLDRDTVVTGPASRAQLLMIDGAKIALRPDSRLVIEEYAFTDPAAAPATITAGDDKSVMNLVKGGFRAITGAIGSNDPGDYEVRTPVGVLGIRGTDYSAVFCRGDCGWAPGVTPGTTIDDGLYLGVVEGGIVFRTPVDTIELGAGEFAFIPLESRRPERLDVPPPVLLDDNDLRFEADFAGKAARPDDGSAAGTTRDGASMTGFDPALGTRRGAASSAFQPESEAGEEEQESGKSEPPAQPQIAIDPDGNPVDITPGQVPQNDPRTIGYSTGMLGTLDLPLSGVLDNDPSQYRLDGNFDLVAFDAPDAGRVGAPLIGFDIGTANNVESGFDSVTVLRWGRWAGGTVSVSTGGAVGQVDLANQSIHWIQGPAMAPPIMPITGVANYTLIGSTSPTDTLGNVGVLGSATFVADFTNLRVDSTLDISIAGSQWTAAGQGNIGTAAQLPAHLFGGFYNVIVDGVTGGSGTFSGFFSDPGPTSDPTFPGGVGLTYSLQDAQGVTTVSGAAAFGNP